MRQIVAIGVSIISLLYSISLLLFTQYCKLARNKTSLCYNYNVCFAEKVNKRSTLQMFCLLNSQMNACEPSLKTTSSDFNRLESITKKFCFHAISKDICLLF